MLVLARKSGESIVIDGEIRVTILGIDGDRVSIGIDAPRSVPVIRQELFDAVRIENLTVAEQKLDLQQIRHALTVRRS